MRANEVLSSSLEDYLEAIFHIVAQKQAARGKDIAQRLGVNNSSVTGALRVLGEKGLINYAPYDIITLTAEGKRVSKDIIRRHEALHDFFVKVLSVDGELADRAACDMEHALPPEILDRLTQFLKFIERGPHCLKGFRREQIQDEDE